MSKEVNIIKIEFPSKHHVKSCEIAFKKVGSILKGRVTIGIHYTPNGKWSFSPPLEMIPETWKKYRRGLDSCFSKEE